MKKIIRITIFSISFIFGTAQTLTAAQRYDFEVIKGAQNQVCKVALEAIQALGDDAVGQCE